MNLSNFQTEFDKMINRDYFSDKVHPMRQEAFSKFLEFGLPTKKWEDWRFTNLSSISKGKFRLSEIQDSPKGNIDISQYDMNDLETIVIYNGHYQEAMSSIPNGVQLLSGSDFLEKTNWEFNSPETSPFDLLNTAFMDSGMSIVVDQNVEVKKPIRMLFISSGLESLMVTPRIHIDLGESSSATFIEHHGGDSSSFFQNGSTFVTLEQNAQLDHIRIQSNSVTTANIVNIQVEQNADSRYTFFQFADGSQLGRLNIYNKLKGEGANCAINGLTLSNDSQHLDNHIITDHQVPHCSSSQNFKTVLQDHSSSVFNGRTIVRKDAQKTDSSQSNKNLLLSKSALVNSNPQLEIYADDVKCAHGSSTGALDKDALFYLRSRGLDVLSAKALLVRGFATELLDRVNHESIREFITQRFDQWLTENTTSDNSLSR
jgi:Fe-S cluster assembly protein SufD